MSVAHSPNGTFTPITPSIFNTPNTQLTEYTDLSQKSDAYSSQVTPSLPYKPNDQYDLDVEEDLTDESSVGQVEPTVQKYIPGVNIDVDLSKLGTPAVVDFYDECLLKYKFESEFVKDETYLIAPSKGWVVKDDQQDSNNSITADLDADKLLFGDGHDAWNICKPHDPLLRCIHSISDRLRIQQLVADPSSYLNKGGDDKHYDIDDPFFDDSDIYTQLNIDKSHVIVNQEIFQNFSPWSEDDSCHESVSTEGLRGVLLNPHNFIAIIIPPSAQPQSQLPETAGSTANKSMPVKLFMNSNGWRKYIRRIPLRLQQPFKEFVTKWNAMIKKSCSNKIGTRVIKDTMDELLKSIFKRMLTLPIKSILLPSEPKEPKSNRNDTAIETGDEIKEENKNISIVKDEDVKIPPESVFDDNTKSYDNSKSSPSMLSPDGYSSASGCDRKRNKKNKRQKTEYIDAYDGNILLPGKLIDSCNKTLRWLISACKSITNAYSPVEFALIWLKMTLEHNKQVLHLQYQQISDKLAGELPKLKLCGCKKFEAFQGSIVTANKQTLKKLRKEGLCKKKDGADETILHLMNIYKYLRSVGRDIITYTQLANLSSSVIISIASSQLAGQLPLELLAHSNPYDVLAKLTSQQFSMIDSKQINLPWQLLYAFVKRYQKSSKTRSLYDGRQKPVVVLMNFSTEKASTSSTIDICIGHKGGNNGSKNNKSIPSGNSWRSQLKGSFDKSPNGTNNSIGIVDKGRKATKSAAKSAANITKSDNKRKSDGMPKSGQETGPKRNCNRAKPAASMKDLIMGKLCPTD
ncbi:conserved Plasmodium protein, unknown function [Babesia microti strain RI]|uniref:Hpc2-related domain-containing protein n=1 Tax=Babesia microti (strain RI) TaxID=1133968 RepID=I7J8U0_BABMR|nr:conserved Plasmodium protein, unknown function [Babesia microti strain RI]CCF73009.1 conserved Plasmodium protein, unknown function [Babesia microti strain RI]|eukprot:XP_012647618.1 conserved Plasmodium protein, unknown function [Babesia microti strain RI]